MQLHPFMPGIDVAWRELLLISTSPFRYFRRGEACVKDKNLYPVWGDDTIWKMLGQLCLVPEQIILSLLKHLRRGYYAGPLYGVLGFSHFWAGTISPGTVCWVSHPPGYPPVASRERQAGAFSAGSTQIFHAHIPLLEPFP